MNENIAKNLRYLREKNNLTLILHQLLFPWIPPPNITFFGSGYNPSF